MANEDIHPTRSFDTTPAKPPDLEPEAVPSYIGRYRVSGILGRGGFGIVYLGHDDQLNRRVAIKVPRREMITRPQDVAVYIAEARMVAALDHPHIVAVYDVGSTKEHPYFVVSKFIEGGTLTQRVKENPLPVPEAAELVAKVAETLHYAHSKGLVHRDIKPGNILLESHGDDRSLTPYVADFGLALNEENFGRGPTFAGTLAYSSPEQVRGEGHRVDGRSDVYSLGVVFYKLLTGRMPFHAELPAELSDQITNVEARPPRQWVDSIPKELERICLKALAKRASDRYTTAKDLADDLRHFLKQAAHEHNVDSRNLVADATTRTGAPHPASPAGLSTVPSGSVMIVPKGLRSFDNHDADFFLELVPGPRDRDGLPESIRFWKAKIEATDECGSMSVGLIYGPSGCGKTSMVKAGLLPRLDKEVSAIYVEATAADTETRLLAGIRKAFPALPANLGLKETLAAVRRGQVEMPTKKLLVVLDQFEQWLHANRGQPNAELAEALRQCDGKRLQCIVMVRDDFWLAVSRFLKELEMRILEGENSALIDLFDPDHAKKVLTAFGRAFGKLPGNLAEMSAEQRKFLDLAVSDLTQEGKVICVRLALFAEMMKGKSWTPASFKAVGGTTGVRVTFLEETFSATTAPPEHRVHQKAARGVLKALLPQPGTNIRGHMKSYTDLLTASGYQDRPEDFKDLLSILDREIRLITPTDPEGNENIRRSPDPTQAQDSTTTSRFYQLTHDYLVPSLRDWLTRKQKETRRGRAELMLAERSVTWCARPERRQLPSLVQWAKIRIWTQRSKWTPEEQKMMQKAGRHYAMRIFVGAAVLILVAWGCYEGYGSMHAQSLRDQLLNADAKNVLSIVKKMAPYRRWIDPLLRDAYNHALTRKDPHKQLYASLALLPVDPSHKTYVYTNLLDAAPPDFGVLREALAPYQVEFRDKLWIIVEKPFRSGEGQRLQAASALASYDSDSERWANVQEQVVDSLVAVQAVHLGRWMDALWPVRDRLLEALAAVYRDHERVPSERYVAANVLAAYAADMPQLLADLLMDADVMQFPLLYPKLGEHGDIALTILQSELAKHADQVIDEDDREKLAKRQANAAVAVWRMAGPASVVPLLKHSQDPTMRSQLIQRIGPLDAADPPDVFLRADAERDVSIRRALVLSLGGFKDRRWPQRADLIQRLLAVYEQDADAGMHAAVEYVLHTLKENGAINRTMDKLRMTEEQIQRQHAGKQTGAARWYVNDHGQTMVVIHGPVQVNMGSPFSEKGREEVEVQHKVQISRTFAISAKAVTFGDYVRFKPNQSPPAPITLDSIQECPVTMTSWLEAAAYCNWLSKQEGIARDQWCYETNNDGDVTKLRAKYLSLTGYRLPTEAEMEYATRAGAATSRYFGGSEGLLLAYAWFVPNAEGRVWPGGRLKPNDLGFFDMHGNVWTWCQEKYRDYPRSEPGKVIEDEEFDLEIDAWGRLLRGGCYTDHASALRSAHRWAHEPSRGSNIIGFRVARTLTAK